MIEDNNENIEKNIEENVDKSVDKSDLDNTNIEGNNSIAKEIAESKPPEEIEQPSMLGVQYQNITDIGLHLTQVKKEISKVVIGQEDVIDQTIISLIAGGHILLEGVPGLGKTLIVKTLAKTFAGEFSRIQFTPDLMPADVSGHSIYNSVTGEFNVKKGPVFTNLLLADEINRAPAKTQSALLEVMQEQQVTIDGELFKVDPPFMVLATQNPIEQEGTYPLPEAQLDRFLMKVYINHLDEVTENKLLTYMLQTDDMMKMNTKSVEAVITTKQIKQIQQIARKVKVDNRVIKYTLDIVRLTRNFSGIEVGSGPRGAIALLACARAKALLDARGYITPDDIKELTKPVLRHRIALSAEAEIEGLTPDNILDELLDTINVPRE